MIYWSTPRFIVKWFSHLEWHYSRDSKIIYLTFDDGPTPEITHKVMNLLDEYHAKGTFFCLGRNVDRHPEIYQEIVSRGHGVGNHTYSHLKGWRTGLKTYIQDIHLAESHIDSKLFRPPYGRIRNVQLRYISKLYRIVMWDVLTHDYNKHIPKELILKTTLRSTKSGSIIVFHDSVKASNNLFYILPRLLEHFSKQGYQFCKID